jgi:YggT family protein
VATGNVQVGGRQITIRKVRRMTTFFAALEYALYLYIVVVLARVVVEITRQFARSWRPVGVAAISLELVYVATDPPIKLLRRLVPPLQVGGVSLDLSILILLLAILALRWALSSYAV